MDPTSAAPGGPPAPITSNRLDEEFWARCAQGRLFFQRCDACGRWRHLPRPMCAICGSGRWQWTESAGRGRIYSWTITHQAMHPAFATRVPYAVVVVELDEGVRMVSALRGLPLDEIALDVPVAVTFETTGGGPVLPFFRPRSVAPR